MCPKIQREVTNIFRASNPEDKDHITGTLDYFLLRRMANNIVQQEVDKGDGSRNEGTGVSPVVQLRYKQRKDPDSFSDGVPTSCATGPETTPCVTDYEISEAINNTWTANEYEIKRLCEGKQSYMMDDMMGFMLAGAKRINNEIADALVLNNIGVFEDGAASKSYRLLNTTLGQIWGLGISDFKNDLTTSRYTGPVNVIGNGNWFTFFDLTRGESAGMQDSGIFIPNRSQNMRMFNDPYLAAQLATTNNALVIENDSIHLTTYNGWKGDFQVMDRQDLERSTIIDPRTGLEWDIQLQRRACTAGESIYRIYWDITIILNWDLFQIPSDAYSAGDVLNGVNGIYNVVGTAS